MFTYMGQNHVEMSSTTMSPPAAFIEEHQQQEQLFMEMETTTRAHEIKKKSTCCSSSINTIVAAAEVLNPNSSSVVRAGSDSCNTKKPKTPRKRSGKKDRHSKIATAQGNRGRRMRLSLDIARRFFSLQDMLGFDKASKTVGWLLSKSKHAIKDLCLPDDNYEDEDEGKSLEDMMVTKRAKKKKKITVGTCKVTTSPMNQGQRLVVDREELRAMARARARERTLDKLKVPKSKQFSNNKGSSHSMGSASSFEIEYEQCPGSTKQINKSADQEDNINNNSIPANFTQNWAIDHVTTIPFPSSTYGAVMHQHLSTTAGDIHEQAVPRSIFTTSSDLGLQSHFADSQLYGKLWEHYYTYSYLR